MASADPYYYGRDIINQQNQSRALGMSKGFTPDELSGIIRGNFQAQQANEVTQRTLALNEKNQAINLATNQRNADVAAKQAKSTGIGQTAMGGTSLAIQSYNAGMWGNKGNVTPANTNVGGVNTSLGGTPTGVGVPALSTTGVNTASGADSLALVNGAVDTTAGANSLALINGEQAAATGAAQTTTAASSTTSLAGAGAGWGQIGYMVGSNVVHGKYSKTAGIAASTIAGAVAGGPWGAAAGFVVGALNALFG